MLGSVSIKGKQGVIVLATTAVAVFAASSALSLNDVASTADLVVPFAYNVITATVLILVALFSAAILSAKPVSTRYHLIESLITAARRVRAEVAGRSTMQQRLTESELRFETAFYNAAIGMYLVDKNRAIFQVNQAFTEMLGLCQK